MSFLIEIKNLYKTFYKRPFLFGKRTEKPVLCGVDLTLCEDEVLGLVGESGCGKTTLSKIILGLETATSGSVMVDGENVGTLSHAGFKTLRRRLQVVFQDPYSSLDPRMTVRQLITEPLEIHGLYLSKPQREAFLQELLASVGLQPEHLTRYPHEFSGGQRQRIAIARALALSPKILVADEPVSALDVSVQAQILNLLKEIKTKRKLSLLFITHDFAVARFLCDRICVMYKGMILESADSETLFANPQHPYTEALFSAVPLPDPDLQKKRQPIAVACNPAPANLPCPFAPRCQYYDAALCAGPIPLSQVGLGHFCACRRLPFKDMKSRFAV